MRLPSTDIQALPPILIERAMAVQNKIARTWSGPSAFFPQRTRPASSHHRRDDRADCDRVRRWM